MLLQKIPMSLFTPLTTTSPPSLHHHPTNSSTKHSPITITTCATLQTTPRCYIPPHLTRRTALIGLGTITTIGRRLPTALGAPNDSPQIQLLPEFGSQPRQLDSIIRVKVPRPKRSRDKTVEVLTVDDIEIMNNGPVRFDVYVDKPNGVVVDSDLGEFAGSLVDLARTGSFTKTRKVRLSLGITSLVEDIGAKDSENLVVSLVPRTGEIAVGGVSIEHVKAV